jgi:hypothetical protein
MGVTTATLDKNEVANFVQLIKHIWISDTIDGNGGFVPVGKWNDGVKKWEKNCFEEDRKEWMEKKIELDKYKAATRELEGSCRCGNVKYKLAIPPPSPDNATEEEVHVCSVKDEDGTYKWRILHCHCNFCRLSSGALAQSFISTSNSRLTITIGTTPLTHYQTSALYNRAFCPRCSTTVWLEDIKHHPGFKHVTVGTLGKSLEAMKWMKGTVRMYLESIVPGSIAEMKELDDGAKRFATE